MSDEPKKGGPYIEIVLPEETKSGDSVAFSFRVDTEITWHATCWKSGLPTDDGCGTTCLLPDNRDGEHVWTRNDEIQG